MIFRQRILLLFGLFALITGLALAATVSAQAGDPAAFTALIETPLCPGAFATSPANPAFISSSEGIFYQWQGEPAGTASRSLVFYNVALNAFGGFDWLGYLETIPVPTPDSANHALPGASGQPGTFNWTVIFYDAAGSRLCRLDSYWLDVREAGGSGEAAASMFVCNGTTVVVLPGSPFGGSGDINPGGDDFDGSGSDACAFIIHGNNNPNNLIGGSLTDQIFGYGGDDTLDGGAGDDTLDGGDELCLGDICSAGDTISGGEGNDVISGGNEDCPGAPNFCDNSTLGDTIDGGPGDDFIDGGDETCTSDGIFDGCDGFFGGVADLGDTINGGEGNDTINGGDEGCTGSNCHVGQDGDNLNGDNGDDVIDGEGGDDTADGGGDTDTCDAETENNCEA